MVQTRQCQSVLYCAIFHSQNIVQYFVHDISSLTAGLFSYILSVLHNKSKRWNCRLHNRNLFAVLKVTTTISSTTCTVNRLSVTATVLSSIAPLCPAQSLYRYYCCWCPSVWQKLGLCSGRYEMLQFCPTANVPQ